MDQFVVFGDSITSQGFTSERGPAVFGPELANAYVRRLDVVLRGLGGYNTRKALEVIYEAIPLPSQANVRFLAIWFGANDARLPNTGGGPQQHVPLEEYARNLKKILLHPRVRAHKNMRIILITPPPVDERKLIESDLKQFPELEGQLRRTAANAAWYAQAVRDVGQTLDIAVLDLWSAMMTWAGYHPDTLDKNALPGSMDAPANPMLQEWLHDGLHFNPSAYRVLYEELMCLIGKTWPDQMPDNLPFVLPRWDDDKAWSGDKLIL